MSNLRPGKVAARRERMAALGRSADVAVQGAGKLKTAAQMSALGLLTAFYARPLAVWCRAGMALLRE